MAISPSQTTFFNLGQDVDMSSHKNWHAAVEAVCNAAANGAPNLIINGDFQINQRGFAGGALSASTYGFDRWKADSGGCNISVSGLTVTLTSGTVVQTIEKLGWGYVTSMASTQFVVSVDTPSADLTITLGSVTGTITAGSGRRSCTITTASGDTGDINLKIAKASGSGVTFSRVRVEEGAIASAWFARSASEETILCQRYYQKLSRGSDNAWIPVMAISSAITRGALFSPVLMRAAPSFTFSANNTFVIYTGAAQFTPTSMSGNLGDKLTGSIRADSTGMTSGAIYELRSATGVTSTIEMISEL